MATLESRYYDMVDDTVETALDYLNEGSTDDVQDAIVWAVDDTLQYYENAGIMYGFLLGYMWENSIHACQEHFYDDVSEKVDSKL